MRKFTSDELDAVIEAIYLDIERYKNYCSYSIGWSIQQDLIVVLPLFKCMRCEAIGREVYAKQ